jgi:hypothetical protein
VVFSKCQNLLSKTSAQLFGQGMGRLRRSIAKQHDKPLSTIASHQISIPLEHFMKDAGLQLEEFIFA